MSKPAKPFKPVIATGNFLATGAVAFRARDGEWAGDVNRADVAADAEAAARLQSAAEADVAANRIVDLALIPVVVDAQGVRPTELREWIRAQGPTIPIPGAVDENR